MNQKTLLILLGAGAAAYYFWNRQKMAEAVAALPQPVGPYSYTPDSGYTVAPVTDYSKLPPPAPTPPSSSLKAAQVKREIAKVSKIKIGF